MKFKTRTATCLTILSAMACNAQNIRFLYDSAGNRIKREIVFERQSKTQKSSINTHSVSLSNKDIKITSSPTDGMLKVDISGIGKDDKCIIYIHNALGIEIYSSTYISSTLELDLSSQPRGIYILSIMINGDFSSWKISKI